MADSWGCDSGIINPTLQPDELIRQPAGEVNNFLITCANA
jgi:hypothetical protein